MISYIGWVFVLWRWITKYSIFLYFYMSLFCVQTFCSVLFYISIRVVWFHYRSTSCWFFGTQAFWLILRNALRFGTIGVPWRKPWIWSTGNPSSSNVGISTIDVPNSHWLVDEYRGVWKYSSNRYCKWWYIECVYQSLAQTWLHGIWLDWISSEVYCEKTLDHDHAATEFQNDREGGLSTSRCKFSGGWIMTNHHECPFVLFSSFLTGLLVSPFSTASLWKKCRETGIWSPKLDQTRGPTYCLPSGNLTSLLKIAIYGEFCH